MDPMNSRKKEQQVIILITGSSATQIKDVLDIPNDTVPCTLQNLCYAVLPVLVHAQSSSSSSTRISSRTVLFFLVNP